MKKRNRRKLEKPLRARKATISGTFSPEEVEKIHNLVSDLKKIRQVNKEKGDVEAQVSMILEQQYFFTGDFIVEQGWQGDKVKLRVLFEYLRDEFSWELDKSIPVI